MPVVPPHGHHGRVVNFEAGGLLGVTSLVLLRSRQNHVGFRQVSEDGFGSDSAALIARPTRPSDIFAEWTEPFAQAVAAAQRAGDCAPT